MRRTILLVVLLSPVVVSACASDDPGPFSDGGVRCSGDETSLPAKDTVEKVGGLRTDDYVVRFAKSTEVGVVALVDRDAEQAFEDLHSRYDVAVVAQISDDDGEGAANGFAQVQQIVDSACG